MRFETARRGPIDVEHQPIFIHNDAHYTIEKVCTPLHVPGEGTGDETSISGVTHMREGSNKGISKLISLCSNMLGCVFVVPTIEKSFEDCSERTVGSKNAHKGPIGAEHQPI